MMMSVAEFEVSENRNYSKPAQEAEEEKDIEVMMSNWVGN